MEIKECIHVCLRCKPPYHRFATPLLRSPAFDQHMQGHVDDPTYDEFMYDMAEGQWPATPRSERGQPGD